MASEALWLATACVVQGFSNLYRLARADPSLGNTDADRDLHGVVVQRWGDWQRLAKQNPHTVVYPGFTRLL